MKSIKEKIRSIIRESFIKEMGKNDIHLQAIMKYYDRGTPSTKKQVAIVVTGKKTSNRGQILNKTAVSQKMDQNYGPFKTQFQKNLDEVIDARIKGNHST